MVTATATPTPTPSEPDATVEPSAVEDTVLVDPAWMKTGGKPAAPAPETLRTRPAVASDGSMKASVSGWKSVNATAPANEIGVPPTFAYPPGLSVVAVRVLGAVSFPVEPFGLALAAVLTVWFESARRARLPRTVKAVELMLSIFIRSARIFCVD